MLISVLSMRPLSALRRLSVTVFEDLTSPSWLRSFLATAPANNRIHEIAFTVLFSNFDDEAWVEIDEVLSESRFGSLCSVTLRYWRRHNQYQLPELRFPSLSSKGILAVFNEGDLVFPRSLP